MRDGGGADVTERVLNLVLAAAAVCVAAVALWSWLTEGTTFGVGYGGLELTVPGSLGWRHGDRRGWLGFTATEIHGYWGPVKRFAVPTWFVQLMGLACGVSAAWQALGAARRRRRAATGLCAACGYDLTGNVSGVCPECGAAAEAVA